MKKTFICPCCGNKFMTRLQNIIMCNKCKFLFSNNVVPNDTENNGTNNVTNNIKEQEELK